MYLVIGLLTLVAVVILMYCAYDLGVREGIEVGMQIMEDEYKRRKENYHD